jgi:hypothetical protein
MSTPLVMCLTKVTCYYYSFWMLLWALVIARGLMGPPLLIASGVRLFMLYAPNVYFWVYDRYTAQSYLFFALGLVVLFRWHGRVLVPLVIGAAALWGIVSALLDR